MKLYAYPVRQHHLRMSFLPLSERDRLTITKLHASASDLTAASAWAAHLLKKKWFRKPWSRGATYSHQSAYITSIVVAYGRVFANGRGGFGFPVRIVDYDATELDLHKRLLDMRHKVYAHSDLERWTVRPWQHEDFDTVILGQPIHLIEQEDLERFVTMTARLLTAIGQRYEDILAPYKASAESCSMTSKIDLAMQAIGQLEVGESLAIRIADHE